MRLSLGGSVYDPTDPVGRLLFNVLAMVAELEADLIRSRTKGGMRVAKAKGHLRGKLPKLNVRQEDHLVELFGTGDYTTSELGDLFGVGRSTVYRALARSKQRAAVAATSTARTPRPSQQLKSITRSPDSPTVYRPRHGATSDILPENRGPRRNRAWLATAPQPGR